MALANSSSGHARRRARRLRRKMRIALTALGCMVLSFTILSIAEYNGPSYAAVHLRPIVSTPPPPTADEPQKAIAKVEKRPPLLEIATTESPQSANALVGRTSIDAAWVLLGLGLSAILAMNALLIDHLRRTYARGPRRPRSQHS